MAVEGADDLGGCAGDDLWKGEDDFTSVLGEVPAFRLAQVPGALVRLSLELQSLHAALQQGFEGRRLAVALVIVLAEELSEDVHAEERGRMMLIIAATIRFDQWSLMLDQLVCRDIPGGMLRPVDVCLGDDAGIRIEQPAGHDPELAVAAQLGHGRTAVPAKAAREARVVFGVHEELGEVFALCPRH